MKKSRRLGVLVLRVGVARSVQDGGAKALLKGAPTEEKTCRCDCPSWIGG